MTKDDVADALDEIGTLLELKGENAFRTNAYHNAARSFSQLPGDLTQMVADRKLARGPRHRRTPSRKITTLVTTGSCSTSTTSAPRFPPGWSRCSASRGSARRR